MTAHMIENIFELRQNPDQNQKKIDDICFFRILLKRKQAQEGEVLHCFLVVGHSSEELQIQSYIMNQLGPTKGNMAYNTTACIVDAWATYPHKTWAGGIGLFAVKEKSLRGWLKEVLQNHPCLKTHETHSVSFRRAQVRVRRMYDPSNKTSWVEHIAEDCQKKGASRLS